MWVADALSRHPVGRAWPRGLTRWSRHAPWCAPPGLVAACAKETSDEDEWPRTGLYTASGLTEEIRAASKDDDMCKQLREAVLGGGWCKSLPLWAQREEVGVDENGLVVLFRGKPVAPEAARSAVLTAVHRGHVGGQAMLAIARRFCFWPGMLAGLRGVRAAVPGLLQECAKQGGCPMEDGAARRVLSSRLRPTTSSTRGRITLCTLTGFPTCWSWPGCRRRLPAALSPQMTEWFATYGGPGGPGHG